MDSESRANSASHCSGSCSIDAPTACCLLQQPPAARAQGAGSDPSGAPPGGPRRSIPRRRRGGAARRAARTGNCAFLDVFRRTQCARKTSRPRGALALTCPRPDHTSPRTDRALHCGPQAPRRLWPAESHQPSTPVCGSDLYGPSWPRAMMEVAHRHQELHQPPDTVPGGWCSVSCRWATSIIARDMSDCAGALALRPPGRAPPPRTNRPLLTHAPLPAHAPRRRYRRGGWTAPPAITPGLGAPGTSAGSSGHAHQRGGRRRS